MSSQASCPTSSGPPSTTRVHGRTVMRGFHSTSLMRYDDMVAVRSGRRTTIAPDEVLERRDAEPAVVDPGRDEHGAGVHVAAVGVHDVVAPIRATRDAGGR